jgi:uncharacterized repeat protein (TIGR03803 family)
MKRITQVFSLWCAGAAIPLSGQTFTTLYSFSGTDGANPAAALVQGTDGNLYGTTNAGGAADKGTVFKMGTGGALTALYSFCFQANCADGLTPNAPLVEAANGEFYGTTLYGGSRNEGTVFEITPGGALTTLYSFCPQGGALCGGGAQPSGGLIQGINGDLYGTTYIGGTDGGYGTVFKIAGGVQTILYSFDQADGQNPAAALVQTSLNGDLYGTTASGGLAGYGTVFKITPSRVLTTLYSFCIQAACADGAIPSGPLVQDDDGNFYGTTSECDEAPGYGTIFQITPAGALTTLHSFNSGDGACPTGVILATDGNLYGTTVGGGANNSGTVFRITPAGAITALYNFCSKNDCADGSEPYGGLLQATDGNLCGTTQMGGTFGTVFKLSLGLAPFVKTLPGSAVAGTTISILGTNLTGATGVTFNGTAAPFEVLAPSVIRATVPAGTTSGKIRVTTPTGTLSSNVPFQVLP